MSLIVWQLIIIAVFLLLPNLPAAWALPKIGKSPWMFLLLCIPIVNVIYIYVLAFGEWERPHS